MASSPFAAMTRLSPQVWLHEHSSSAAAAAPSPANAPIPIPPPPPKVILLASWMGARDLHIAKYTARYAALYPSASILVVKFDPAQLWFSAAGRRAVGPAVAYLQSMVASGELHTGTGSGSGSARDGDDGGDDDDDDDKKHKPQLLIHLFSNGGATTMQNIYLHWHKQQQSPPMPFPASVAIYDSAPGLPTLASTYRAFSISLLPKQAILRAIFTPVLAAFCLGVWFHVRFVLKALLAPLGLAELDPLSRNFIVLNDSGPSISSSSTDDADADAAGEQEGAAGEAVAGSRGGMIGRQTLRTYIYSKEDDLIDYRDCEKHAADAVTGSGGGVGTRGKKNSHHPGGGRVKIPCRLEMFHGSGHVAHMRHDPDRYWRVVGETWAQGTR
ncbi:uncharacterized protein B0I36DRAFT_343870 [Microdochium trichocladiopsis]|uniref:Indole-diterpene biosynthesis protein PaxU n=1 Tax=Microdochium trichocladiopsis TaxID=1682393 RepID=A0A9P8YGG4_9PEZI|nr:uncharacterized protein B0I36DRAFT_343870 [Microdochium trichocladiopsis]KAH7040071.1 hypothetical protein B0I36DRAFT_343870 [Microdochium trichocladiopsis]